jgi:hypothetical protein
LPGLCPGFPQRNPRGYCFDVTGGLSGFRIYFPDCFTEKW